MTTALYTLLTLMTVLLSYTWLAYPLLLLQRARRHRRAALTEPITLTEPPPLLFIMLSAFNEEDVIAARIQNILDADYPASRMHLLIGTDGCTDSTATRAREAAAQAPHILIEEYAANRGKVAVLRDLVRLATQLSDGAPALLVFTDANTCFRADALRRLAHHFTDPAIGGVCGRLVFKGDGGSEEHTYWNLENRLKAAESSLDSCLGANGAIYAIRQECFWPDIPGNTIVDDFVIGMKVREAGWRMCYDPSAIAEEDLPAVRDEWHRRIRIGSGDYQAALLCKACLRPRFGRFAWSFWSHKILRWFTPHMLLVMIAVAVSATLRRQPPPAAVLAADAICLGTTLLLLLAAAGRWSRRAPHHGLLQRLCRGADHFITMQAALLIGFIRFCRGNLAGTWKRTPRTGS